MEMDYRFLGVFNRDLSTHDMATPLHRPANWITGWSIMPMDVSSSGQIPF